MIIVLNNWRILPEKVPGFIEYWSTMKLKEARGLICEFLSRVEGPDVFARITWQLEPSEAETDRSFWKSAAHVNFVNVSMWESVDDLTRVLGASIDPDPRAMNEFEAAPRRRAIVTPHAWRIGMGTLPALSSEGVVA